MRILLLLIPVSLVLLGIAIAAFVWAVRRGQFDDLDTPALDILVDDDRPRGAATPRDASGDQVPVDGDRDPGGSLGAGAGTGDGARDPRPGSGDAD